MDNRENAIESVTDDRYRAHATRLINEAEKIRANKEVQLMERIKPRLKQAALYGAFQLLRGSKDATQIANMSVPEIFELPGALANGSIRNIHADFIHELNKINTEFKSEKERIEKAHNAEIEKLEAHLRRLNQF
jgi:hypothetical protein